MKTQNSNLNKMIGAACAMILSAASSQAVDRFWINPVTDSYTNTANWTGGVLPNGGDNAINNSGAGNSVLINAGDPDWTVNDIRSGDGAGNSGPWIQSGANVTLNGWFRLGIGGGTGDYTMSGGSLTVNSDRFLVGEGGSSVFTMTGGTINKNNGGQFAIPENGTGVFNQTNGTVNVPGGEFWVGQGGGAVGTYNLFGTGTLNSSSWTVVGRAGGNGTMNMGDSTIVTKTGGGNFIVGDNSVGLLNQSGSSSISVNNEFWVGQGGAGNGLYNMSENAAITVNSWVAIGRDGGTGVVNMTNNASFTHGGGGSFIIGASGPGTLNQDGGSVTVNTLDSWIGENGAGVWNQNSGNNVLAFLQFGRNASGSGVLNLNGGTVAVNEIAQGAGVGILNFNGGTLRARTSGSLMSGVSGLLMAGGAVIDSQSFDVTVSSLLSDGAGGNLTKLGSGKLTLTGTNTYVGTTTVSAGKLVEGNATLVTSDVTVANGAGFGAAVVVVGSQAIHTNATLTGPVASLDFALGGFGNPTVAPLNVTNLTVNGTITVNVSASVLAVGTVPLMDFTSISGAHTFVVGTLPAGVAATVNETANQLQLVITSAGAPRWDGAALGTWNIGANLDWFDLGTLAPTTYQNGQPVIFDDAALGTTTVTLNAGTYTPSSVLVTNDTLAYTFTGAGAIGGATSLVKTGTNSLTIANVNSYTGPTLINGGTLSVSSLANGGSPSAIGSSSANATNLVLTGGTLSITGPSSVTDRGYTLNPGNNTLNIANDFQFDGAITANGGGNFIKTGNGTLSVKRTGANTLSAGGGGDSYQIRDGTVVLDGSAGAQVNTITGEIWPGGTTNGTGGHLVLTNTTLNVSSWFAIARGTGTAGQTSSASLYNSALRTGGGSIGYNGNIVGSLQTGFLTLNGTSTYTNVGDGNWGESEGTTAIITLNDSSVMHSDNRVYVGWDNPGSATGGTGILALASSSKFVVDDNMYVGLDGGNGSVVVGDSAQIVVNTWMSIGNESGNGSLVVKDNASARVGGDLNSCDVNGGTGDILVKDNATINANNLFVGKGATSVGTFTITNNATVVSTNGLGLGNGGGSTGTLNLDGGSLSVNLIEGFGGGLSINTVNFNGGKVTAHAPYFGPDFIYNLTAANVLAGGAVIEIVTNDVRSIPQPLLDGGTGGGLTKLGTGTLLLNGVNTYTGNTVATGTLGGAGTIAGNVSAQHLSPGSVAGVGQLTIGGNLTFSGDLNVEVATSVSPSNDVIAVTGTVNKTGAGTVTVSNVGPILVVGQKFYLFNQPVVGGGAMTVTGGSATWQNDLAVDGSITVLTVTVTPAPVFNPGSVATLPDGNKSVTGTGNIGQAYRLWASPDVSAPLNTWTLLNTGTITVSPFTINDLNATNFPSRFYIFSTP